MARSRYIVGIDLGTTNCAVAYVDSKGRERPSAEIRLFEVPQLVAAGETAPRPPSVTGDRYATAEEFRSDLVAIAHSLGAAGERLLATGGALGRLIRTVETCGFHLAALDLRQNADVHEGVVADLLASVGRAAPGIDLRLENPDGNGAARTSIMSLCVGACMVRPPAR